MEQEILVIDKKVWHCDRSKSCPIRDAAFSEADDWKNRAMMYEHEAQEWKRKAIDYEQILKVQSLLKEKYSRYSILARILSIDNIDSLFISGCYIVGFASILFGIFSNISLFINIGVLSLILVTVHNRS